MSDFKHNRGGYVNHGCRCDDCTSANTEAIREYRARRADRRFPAEFEGRVRLVHPDATHGTTDGWENYSCRCPACTKAHRDACRRWAQR